MFIESVHAFQPLIKEEDDKLHKLMSNMDRWPFPTKAQRKRETETEDALNDICNEKQEWQSTLEHVCELNDGYDLQTLHKKQMNLLIKDFEKVLSEKVGKE